MGDDRGGETARDTFRVTTERMPDGRLIHYYEWPDDAEPGSPEPDAQAPKQPSPSPPPDE